MSHVPVLLKEITEIFDPKPGKKYIDATANGGGHTSTLREAGAKVLPIEWDDTLARKLKIQMQNVKVINDSYVNIEKIAKENGFMNCDGILFDLGFSSWHMEESGRGFSFQRDEPLNMRYGGEGETAIDILNTWREEDIARILKEYGEERFDGRIASAIVKARPIHTTFDLVEVIKQAVPFSYRKSRIHFATRTFQALRIAVNHELENLQKGLEGAVKVVRPGGKVAVISFHSLEDRIVKRFFKKSKMIRPKWEEVLQNRRARSAKLRIFERDE